MAKIQPSPQLQNNLKRMGAMASTQPTRTFGNQNPGRIEKNPNPKRPTRDVVGETRGILAANEPYLNTARAHARAMQGDQLNAQERISKAQLAEQANARNQSYGLDDRRLRMLEAEAPGTAAYRNNQLRQAEMSNNMRHQQMIDSNLRQKESAQRDQLATRSLELERERAYNDYNLQMSRTNAESENARAQIALAQQAQQRQAYEFDQSQKLGRFNTLMSFFR